MYSLIGDRLCGPTYLISKCCKHTISNRSHRCFEIVTT
uniref:Uncharacterized protein n=1 Tax=Rhizophora mucronata TaxID=61149 RepID=A0A2P2KDM4_RHIMU